MYIDITATLIALLTFFGISAIMVLSLNLEYGLAGIPNFGQALFVSIGAYTAAWTYTHLLPLLAGQEVVNPCGSTLGNALQLRSTIMKTLPAIALSNFLITLVLAAAIGGFVGWLASYPALRLQEEWYLALVLLVGSEIVRILVRNYDPLICGDNGISGLAQPFTWLPEPRLKAWAFAFLVLGIAAAAYFYCERLTRSPFGRLIKAIRENDRVALGLGKPVARVRGQVMFIGSALAAISGVLFVVNSGFASANDYVVALTLNIWVMAVLGGLGNNRGALLGALVITVLERATAIFAIQANALGWAWNFNYMRYILFGLILLLMLRYRRQGLWPEPVQTTAAHEALTIVINN